MSALRRALPVATARSRRPGRLKSLVVYGSALTIVLFVLFPLYWIVVNSLRPESELARTGLSYVPTAPTLQNYGNVISSRFPYFQLLRNSLVVATGTAAVSLVVAVAAAYAAARYRFRGRDAFLLVILLSYLIPQVLLLVPMYVILRDLGLLNTYPGLIVAHSTSAVPFAIWMLTGYFRELPRELEEAAWIDGAGWLQTIRHVVLPLAVPGLIAAGLFAFLASWNEFLYASAIVQKIEFKTLPLGLFAATESNNRIYWGEVTAAGVLTALPVALLFGLFQTYFVRGLTQGALKG
jgi:multiple sugar transport system permease protein